MASSSDNPVSYSGWRQSKWISFHSAQRGQRGESVVNVLVAVAITGVAVAVITIAIGNMQLAQKNLKVSQGMNKFQEALRTTVAKVSRDFAANGCLNNSAHEYTGTLGSGQTTGAYTLNSTPYDKVFADKNMILSGSAVKGAGFGFMSAAPTVPSGAPADLVTAAARCGSPVFKSTVSSVEYYRFCLKVNRPSDPTGSGAALAAQAKDSFWSPNASSNELLAPFVEMLVIPVNLVTDTPIKCADFSLSGQNGLKVLYTAWWGRQAKSTAASQTDYRHLNGIFYVTKN